MGTSANRAPSGCPVCGDGLLLTRVSCEACGTELTGRFARCEFCSLGDDQRDLLRVFLRSWGNLKELQRHLGVSYPTARARFAELLRSLELASTSAPDVAEERLKILQALASGEIDSEAAEAQLSNLGVKGDAEDLGSAVRGMTDTVRDLMRDSINEALRRTADGIRDNQR